MEAYSNQEEDYTPTLTEEDTDTLMNIYAQWFHKRRKRTRQEKEEIAAALSIGRLTPSDAVIPDNKERIKMLEFLHKLDKEMKLEYNKSRISLACNHLVRSVCVVSCLLRSFSTLVLVLKYFLHFLIFFPGRTYIHEVAHAIPAEGFLFIIRLEPNQPRFGSKTSRQRRGLSTTG